MDLSSILKDLVRKHDILARYGGEEFIILLPETGLPGGRAAAEKIRSMVENLDFPGMEGRQVTVSLGVAALMESGETNIDRLINLADEGLYRAKGNGRNRVETVISVKDNNGQD